MSSPISTDAFPESNFRSRRVVRAISSAVWAVASWTWRSSSYRCRAAGLEPELAVEGGEMDAVLRFVEAGLGLAVVPSMVLKNRPGLRGTPLARPRLLRTVALARRGDVEPSHSADAFRRHLNEYL